MPKKDIRVYMFVDDVTEEFICVHCHKVLQDAVKLRDCQHSVCKTCFLRRVKQDLSSCPCSEKLVKADNEATNELRRAVGNLLVYCSKNCGEQMKLQDLDDHLANFCVMKKTVCPNANAGCLIKLKRKDLDEHLKSCDYRLVSCNGCGKRLKYIDLRRHQKAQGCMEQKWKQIIVRQLRNNDRELKKHIVNLKQESYKSLREERSLQKDYMWKRIERNPEQFSPTLVRSTPELGTRSAPPTCSRDRVTPNYSSTLPPISPQSSGCRKIKSQGGPTICKNCSKPFLDEFNKKMTCSWHAGVSNLLCHFHTLPFTCRLINT
eukprot:gene9316-10299_t